MLIKQVTFGDKMINETFKKMQNEFKEENNQGFYVVTTVDSCFLGVYSSLQRAKSIIKMMGGKYNNKDLMVAYEYLDDPLSRKG